MTRRVFDQSHITAWSAALDDKPPELTEVDFDALPQVDAFRAQVWTSGMTLNMRCRNGKVIALKINPVAARHLAACILTMGQAAGWLNASADVICPDAPPLDS